MHASVIKPHVSTKHLNDHQFLIFPNSLKIRVSQSAGFKGESLLAARHGKHRPPALPAEGPPGDANNELTSSCSSSSSSSSYCRLDAVDIWKFRLFCLLLVTKSSYCTSHWNQKIELLATRIERQWHWGQTPQSLFWGETVEVKMKLIWMFLVWSFLFLHP